VSKLYPVSCCSITILFFIKNYYEHATQQNDEDGFDEDE